MTTNTNAASGAAGRFTKKPVTIEAVRYTRRFNWPEWFHNAVSRNDVIVHGTGKFAGTDEPCYCEIKTLEGSMRADEGDWIIRGVKGELYPCKPDIFEATYSRAALSSAAAQPAGEYPPLPKPALPKITAEDRSFLHDNPNTDDIVKWVQNYASAAVNADRAMRAQEAPAAGNWVNAADVDRLVRELDVALNGEEGAAPQASLCDVVGQAKAEAAKLGRPLLAAPAARQCVECASCGSAFEVDTYMAGYTECKGHCLNCPGINRAATEAAPAAVAGPSDGMVPPTASASELFDRYPASGKPIDAVRYAKQHGAREVPAYGSRGNPLLLYPDDLARMLAASAAPTTQAAPVAQGDALDELLAAAADFLDVSDEREGQPGEDWQSEANRRAETRLRAAIDAARAQAKEGTSHG